MFETTLIYHFSDGILGVWSLIKRHFKVLIVSCVLLLAAVPLQNIVCNLSDADSSEGAPALYVRHGSDRNESGLKYVPGEVIIKFKREAAEGEIAGLRVGLRAEEAYVSPFTFSRVWRVPPSKTVEEWTGFFGKHPLVEYAEPNFYVYASMAPNDPAYSYQWHLDNAAYGGIHMEAAWDVETGDPDVVVAVVDTGVAYEDYPAPPYWHIDTYKAYSGHSWWCGVSEAPSSWTALHESNSTPPGYGNGWKEYLQHSFDLTDATGKVTFSYQFCYHLEKGYDYAYVEVSSDDGLSWVQLKSYTGPLHAPATWRPDSVDLTDYKGSNILVRFRVYSDEIWSDEDGKFDSEGAFFVDEIELKDRSNILFYDDVESGAGEWETTHYEQAPDLTGTSFWINSGEVPGDEVDNDGNGYVDDVNGWDFMNSDAHPNDDNAHGTHVSGTVAQTTNNNLGVAGVAFGTTIMPVKVLNSAGTGTDLQVADGIYYAVNNGADIINLSLGGTHSDTLENAVAYAYNNGVTVFAASGNGGDDGIGDDGCDYPAGYDAYVIAVGATQYDETKASYSNYGSSLDVVAPGGDVTVDQNGDGYGDGVLQNTFGDSAVDWAYWFYQGTSMATPHASGVASLLLSVNPGLTPSQIKNVLESTAEDLGTAGRDDVYGWGLIDAQAATTFVKGMIGHFDFGTMSSPIEYGYNQVTESTLYSASLGYGWSSTAGLDCRDRAVPDNLRRDLIFSPTEHTFNVDLANGDYQVTIVMGDESFGHDMMDVYAEGVLVINDLTAAAGSFQEVAFYTTVVDGQLSLGILDDGGADPNWVINVIVIEPV